VGRYGPRVYLDYDAGPMAAQAVGSYNSLFVHWTTPGGAWSTIRLVRNAYGVPVSETDGTILVEGNSGPAATGTVVPTPPYFTDNNLEGGRFQYYAIWLYAPAVGQWTRAASCTGLPLLDTGYSNRLWELMPSVHRTTDEGLLDNDNTTLQTFLKIFGYQLDGLRAEYETLRDVNNTDKVSGNLLPLVAQQWGQFFEPELGMKQMRILLRNSVHLYRNKGTVPGVTGFVSAISGYGATLLPLKNLVLDYNDSSAEESVGRWTATSNGTLARYVADGTVDAGAALAAGMRAVGVFSFTNTANGAATMTLGNVNPIGTGIPVVGGTTYTASVYARAGATSRSCTLAINWYDATGTLLSSDTGAAVATAVGAWTARLTVTAAAPATAVYAGLTVGIPSAALAGEITYLDGFQFEPGAAATAYTDARLLDINVLAPRVNLVTNPNFETDTAGWSNGGGATLARSTAIFHSGTASMSVTMGTPTTDYAVYSPTYPLVASTTYTASIWVYGPAREARLMMAWQASGVDVGTPVFSPSQTLVANTWTRLSISGTVPAGATGGYLLFRSSDKQSGDVFYIDDVLLEPGAALQTYFDGTSYASTGETIWETTANESRSHYYPQRRAKNYRMLALLPQYTSMGSSFRLNYAQPLV
jgi:hypothetical protein